PQVIGISANEVGELTFSPVSLVFPSQSIGTTSQKTVTVTGNDIENGILLTIATSGDFSEAGDLSPCFLKQGGKCSITVSLTPTHRPLSCSPLTCAGLMYAVVARLLRSNLCHVNLCHVELTSRTPGLR